MNDDMKILSSLCLSNQIKFHPTPPIIYIGKLANGVLHHSSLSLSLSIQLVLVLVIDNKHSTSQSKHVPGGFVNRVVCEGAMVM